MSYIIFEYKRRTVLDIQKIRVQYEKYSLVDPSCLDSLIIPIPDISLPIFINTIFYNTPNEIITQIKNNINFSDKDGILIYNTRGSQARIFQQVKQSENQINDNIINSLISLSHSEKLWNRIILPFTFKDLEGIEFLDTSRNKIRIRSDVSSSIIISHLFSFISQRKRRNIESKFHIEDFFDHLFSSIRRLATIGDDDKRAITRKLDLFLQFVCDVCSSNKLTLLKESESESNYFIILIKKTDNFVSRMDNIRKKLDYEIEIQKTQNRIVDFF